VHELIAGPGQVEALLEAVVGVEEVAE